LKKYFTIKLAAIIFAAFALLSSVLDVSKGNHKMIGNVWTTRYNNYLIFKQSFWHLVGHQNLYIHYNSEQYDLYKYAPTFALMMAPFAYLPDMIGLSLWNLLNALLLWYAIKTLPFSMPIRNKMAWFVLLEMLTAIQNDQSNALLVALLLLAYTSLEQGKVGRGTALLSLATYIKIFPVVAFAWILFYPTRWKGIAWSAFHIVWMALLPMLFVGASQLFWQYQNWGVMLAQDFSDSFGLSVMAWCQIWFGIVAKKEILGLGILVFIVFSLLWTQYNNARFRINMVAFTLIWMVVFNHKAESPTFVIAMVGVGLWYFTKEKVSILETILIVLAFIFTSLSPTDLFPRALRQMFVTPYILKAVPCIWIWFKIAAEIVMEMKTKPESMK
jgi:hypothetical protein